MVIAFCRSQRLLHAHTSHCAQRQNAAGPASSSGEEGTASQQGWLGCWHGQRSWNIECLGTKDNPSGKSHCVVHWRAELSQGLGTSSFPWVQHKGGTWLPHPQCLWLPHGVDTGKLTFCSPTPSTVFLLLMAANLSLCHEQVWPTYWLFFLSFTLIKKIFCTDGIPKVSLLFLEKKLKISPKYLLLSGPAGLLDSTVNK